ncbi:MAG: putative D-isomer specific 2-hydroxyacid dehydrogenase [Polaromonas sp.]|nr:putative D-isomer specific 2-hydroxyacid dehydrogenase [Polaromonas sp.]
MTQATTDRVLQIGPITPPLDAHLPDILDVHPLWKEKDPQSFLAAQGASFRGIVTHVRHACPASLIEALPNLGVISNFGVGYDKIDVAAAQARGVQVATTPNVLNNCVADLAIGLLIDVARGLSATDRFVRRGEWAAGKQRPLMTRVSGKKLGILGFGGIGQTIARRVSGFDMTVRYSSRKPLAGYESQHMAGLKDLAAWADFLVVACPGGPATRHMVSEEVLNALGKDGVLVNIARGSVVDESALVAALTDGRIAGAGLDVYENEPNIPQALLEMDNVVLMSHIAGFTRESRLEMEKLVCDNLLAYFRTGQALTPLAS